VDLVGVGYGDDTVEVHSDHAHRGPSVQRHLERLGIGLVSSPSFCDRNWYSRIITPEPLVLKNVLYPFRGGFKHRVSLVVLQL
jgi:hypothetical protein